MKKLPPQSSISCWVLIGLCSFSLLLNQCTSDDDDDNDSIPGHETAFIITTDYSTGSFTTIELTPPRTANEGITEICSDAIARFYLQKVFVVGRLGCDYIRIYDPGNNFTLDTEYSVGSGTNPQDIAVVDETKAYVSRLASTTLLVLNPLSGEVNREIDLSEFADDDGFPDMYYLYYLEDQHYLFVIIQRLYEWVPQAPSSLIVIDTRTDTILQQITLQGVNPYTDYHYDQATQKLHVGCVGNWAEQDGGIEVIDVATLQSEGFLISESQLGGDLLEFEIYSESRGYALLTDYAADDSPYTKVVPFNPETGEVNQVLLQTSGFYLSGLGLNDRQELWILDRTITAPAIHIFNAAEGSLIEKVELSDLPPSWIVFIND